MRNSSHARESHLESNDQGIDPGNSILLQQMSSPIINNKSTNLIKDKSEPIVRNKLKRVSQIRRLRTEDFGMKNKLLNKGFLARLQIKVKNLQQLVYLLLEDPSSSIAAFILQYALLFSILMSCAALITDSMIDPNEDNAYYEFSSYLELYLFVFFGSEYVLRLLSCNAFDGKLVSFLVSPTNLIDVLAILPFILSILLENASLQQLRVIRMVRFLRVFRIFKISRFLKDMTILVDTVQKSVKDILILISIFGFMALIFATLLFYAESNFESDLKEVILSIPDGLWWSITTMTTVGYGDKVPQTVQGKFIACFTAFLGISTISLPVAVMSMNLTATLKNQKESASINKLKQLLASKEPPETEQTPAYEKQQQLNFKELKFMENRLQLLYENNQKIVQYVEQSQQMFDEVTQDLMSLYAVLADQMDMHFESKLKSMKAKHRIMKMEKNNTQKKSLNLKDVVVAFKEKQQQSQNSILHCEESVLDVNGSFVSRKHTEKKSLQRVSRQKISYVKGSLRKFPFMPNNNTSLHEIAMDQNERSRSQHNSSILSPSGTNKKGVTKNILDNVASQYDFQFDFKGSSGENVEENEACDLNQKMRSLSITSEVKFKMNQSLYN